MKRHVSTADEVKSRLHETAYLNPELTIIFEDRRQEQQEHIEYHEPDGIIGFIRDLNKNKEVPSMIRFISREKLKESTVEGAIPVCE